LNKTRTGHWREMVCHGKYISRWTWKG